MVWLGCIEFLKKCVFPFSQTILTYRYLIERVGNAQPKTRVGSGFSKVWEGLL